MIKLSDYLWRTIARSEHCGSTVFLVAGGGCMHLLDSVGRTTGLEYVCTHHEQAASIAAEAYARVTNRIGVALVTTGPGGTNAVTGVMGAWVDSIPMLVVSGQVKLETTIRAAPGLRQLGDQEINIVDIVRPITKYSAMITDWRDVRYHLERAIHLARSGRPGPVWLDVPLDIQAAMIDESELRGYDPAEDDPGYDMAQVDRQVDEVAQRLAAARRPVIVAGNGVRLAGAVGELRQVVESLGIPLLTTISGIDLVESDHPLFFGRPGILGARAANFVMQNSDLLLVIGTRMNIRIIGYAFSTVARRAFKVMVDADRSEMAKPTFQPDVPVHADARDFLHMLLSHARSNEMRPDIDEWLGYCRRLRSQYPVVDEHQRVNGPYVSSYFFAEALSRHAPPNATVLTGNGTAYTSTFQAFGIKRGQRLFANVGCAAMGYDLPAAVGASYGIGRKQVVLVTGDGSLMMNLQELQTIKAHDLPVKIFVFNNEGYLSIKITQDAFFSGCYTGSDPSSGVKIPDLRAIAHAIGFETRLIRDNRELDREMPGILESPGALFVEVLLDPHEKLGPKAFSVRKPDGTMVSRPLEDLHPFLDREEFRANMIIEPLEDN
jgi:acetolactate synthase-1/2/3 large subunit